MEFYDTFIISYFNFLSNYVRPLIKIVLSHIFVMVKNTQNLVLSLIPLIREQKCLRKKVRGLRTFANCTVIKSEKVHNFCTFMLIPFLGTFLQFFHGFKISIKFCVVETIIEILWDNFLGGRISIFWPTLKPNGRETAKKKKKKISKLNPNKLYFPILVSTIDLLKLLHPILHPCNTLTVQLMAKSTKGCLSMAFHRKHAFNPGDDFSIFKSTYYCKNVQCQFFSLFQGVWSDLG